MLTCQKIYSDIPFAHRQHKHQGHCRYIHGHNWKISITFGCHKVDDNGFVVDFGRLEYIKSWIDKNLDHAVVFCEDDPLKDKLKEIDPSALKLFVVPNCSCEGIAEYLTTVFNEQVDLNTNGRVFVLSVEVFEDSKNSAKYLNSKISS